MKNQKMQKEISANKVTEIKKIDSATLKIVAEKVVKAKKEKSPKVEKERKTATKEKNYIYKFQIADTKLSDKDAKKYRNKLRRKMLNITNLIIVSKDKRESIKDFIALYKKEYILNDFSLASFSNSSDETKREDFEKVLSLVKSSLAKK